MTIVREVLGELFAMFLADARLSAAVLVLAGLAAAVIAWTDRPLLGGGLLLVGCLAVLFFSVWRAARR